MRKNRCLNCKGTGEVELEERNDKVIDICPVCRGQGYIEEDEERTDLKR